MAKYAQGTSVPVSRSQGEIEQILKRFGADQFSSGWTAVKAVIMFRMNERYIRIEVPIPPMGDLNTPSWNRKKGFYYNTDTHDAEVRRRWRAMVLYLKAKLESVNSEIISFEQAFLSHMLLPNKQTVHEYLAPQIEAAYSSGDMPKQLPGY